METPARVARVVDVRAFTQALFNLQQYLVLFDEDGAVALRLAVDKGGAITKVLASFTLARLSNSPDAFLPLARYRGEGVGLFGLWFPTVGNDDKKHLRMALGDLLRDLSAIRSVHGGDGDHALKLFVIGDYMALGALLGHDGPSSSFPCIFCEAPKEGLDCGDFHRRQIDDCFTAARQCTGNSFCSP